MMSQSPKVHEVVSLWCLCKFAICQSSSEVFWFYLLLLWATCGLFVEFMVGASYFDRGDTSQRSLVSWPTERDMSCDGVQCSLGWWGVLSILAAVGTQAEPLNQRVKSLSSTWARHSNAIGLHPPGKFIFIMTWGVYVLTLRLCNLLPSDSGDEIDDRLWNIYIYWHILTT